ncbi:hypothetical protein OMCYN_01105 [cyanobiont of Ornithocercus magnificus]|nr:hypothetical protein OMCYN_01105 [cyanobiont of Ornithocercus magnificus]
MRGVATAIIPFHDFIRDYSLARLDQKQPGYKDRPPTYALLVLSDPVQPEFDQ